MICEKKDCTGCFACYNICPKNAIEMQEDEMGYIYPIIDQKKCINCGMSKNVCPNINMIKLHESKKAYAMWNNNKNIRNKSTSGGIATTLCEYIIENNGVAYGCNNKINDNIKFIRIEKKEDLYKIQGSKYVHAYVLDNYKRIKDDLINGRTVMFIGSPCQVVGLKNFLGKEYENLYTADIVCHGVPSQKLLKEEINNKLGDKGDLMVTFRENGEFGIKVYFNKELVLNEKQDKNFYFLGFMKSLFYRENCYNCKYANNKRSGDITLGDFWGINKDDNNGLYEREEKSGISLCLVNTGKGEQLINSIKDKCYCEERKVEEAIKGNAQLRSPSIRNKEYFKFKKLYLKYGYKKASKKCLKIDKLKKKIKTFLSKEK